MCLWDTGMTLNCVDAAKNEVEVEGGKGRGVKFEVDGEVN